MIHQKYIENLPYISIIHYITYKVQFVLCNFLFLNISIYDLIIAWIVENIIINYVYYFIKFIIDKWFVIISLFIELIDTFVFLILNYKLLLYWLLYFNNVIEYKLIKVIDKKIK